jgi:hypothetical protein
VFTNQAGSCLTAPLGAQPRGLLCRDADQLLAAYEKFARICAHSLTLVGTRVYLSRSRETRRELREKQMELPALLPISTAPSRTTSFGRRNSSPAL